MRLLGKSIFVATSRFKLLCLDIDGTLVDHRIPKIQELDLKSLLLAAKALKVIFNTGRSWSELQPIFEQIGFIPELSVCAGGGLVLDHRGQVLRSLEIASEKVPKLVLDCLKETSTIHICAQGKWRRYVATELYQHVHALSLHFETLISARSVRDLIQTAYKELHATVVADSDNPEKGHVVISHAQANKGDGLKLVMERLKIDSMSVVSIGDMPIDIPMFKASGLSIAMGNATEDTKKAASRVTKSVAEFGVTHAIKKYVL